MKKVLLIMGAVFFTGAAMAQSPTREGNFIIDGYAGIPNWANSILYNNYDGDQSGVENYKLNGGLLSYGGRVEYLVADNFGVGVDVNYEVSGFNYDALDSTFIPATSTYAVEKRNYDYKAKKLRVMARFNYHFVQTDRVDAYAGFAGGYKHVNRVFSTDDPDYVSEEATGALIPVTLRLALGTRVYFTENIGAMVELGAFGGALLQFGISAKF